MSDPDSETEGEPEQFEYWNGLRGSSSRSGDDDHMTPLFSLLDSSASIFTRRLAGSVDLDIGLGGDCLTSSSPSACPGPAYYNQV